MATEHMTLQEPAAGLPVPGPGGSRRGPSGRWRNGAVPYLLVLPSLVVVAGVLGYPMYQLVTLSFQQYKLRQLLGAPATFVGLDNYVSILGDSFFWTVVARTVGFTVVAVGLTLVLGFTIAMLLRRVHPGIRILVNSVLVLVWAMPALVSIAVWQWMFDYEFGVVNWLLARLGMDDYTKHNWFVDPRQGFLVIVLLVVWGAIPFVAITFYAGLTQVPLELEEAARVDGASRWQVLRWVTLPILRPVIVILASLSTIWDFQVFQQVYIMLNGKPSKDYFLISIYSFVESFGVNDYGRGSAIAVVMVLMLLVAAIVYIRSVVRAGEVR